MALAQRTLGRLAHTHGRLTEAASLLQQALHTFTTIHARFEAARTHLDLASLAHIQGNPKTTTRHLTEAHTLFVVLQVPKYVERTAQLASELGVSLPESTDKDKT